MGQDFYDQLIEREENVVALHCEDVSVALKHFRVLCRHSGRSVYHWSPEDGLLSLKASDISVPGSRKLNDALRHVQQSMHYGIYVFSDIYGHLQHRGIEHLRSLAESSDGYQKKIILLGQEIRLPGLLADCVYHVFEQPEEHVRPRLRDGRWVVV
ncbi:MAG: hypothetical protein AB8B96_15570 [Lysobacterales bacterium]